MEIRKLAFRKAVGAVALALVAGVVSAQTIVVGGKGFTEQQLIAELTSQLLAANGFKPDKRVGMGTRRVGEGRSDERERRDADRRPTGTVR